MFQLKALIIEQKILGAGYYFLKLLAPEIAAAAQAGQFIQIRVAESQVTDPLLARPISIYSLNEIEGTVAVIYKAIGRGTGLLAAKKTGELLEILGPLGNGFSVPAATTALALIAGGVGMPPLFCLALQLKRAASPVALTLFYGGRSRADLLELDQWDNLGVKIWAATDDGSYGFKGLVTELFAEQYQQMKYDFIAACGPTPMLQAVQKVTVGLDLPGQISLEAHMACGVGACLGCACKTDQGYQRVCVDGPVFPISEVNFS